MIPLSIRKLNPRAIMPVYASTHAAGMDLSACLEEPVTLAPGARAIIPTGLTAAIAEGYEGQVRPRSGLAAKSGISIPNAPGTIDSDYRGEIGVILINLGSEPFVVRHGDRIAQLVIAPVCRVEISEVEALPETERGTGGFGSTGK